MGTEAVAVKAACKLVPLSKTVTVPPVWTVTTAAEYVNDCDCCPAAMATLKGRVTAGLFAWSPEHRS